MRIYLEDSPVLRQQIRILQARLGVHTVPEVVRRCLAEVVKMSAEELGVPPFEDGNLEHSRQNHGR